MAHVCLVIILVFFLFNRDGDEGDLDSEGYF